MSHLWLTFDCLHALSYFGVFLYGTETEPKKGSPKTCAPSGLGDSSSIVRATCSCTFHSLCMFYEYPPSLSLNSWQQMHSLKVKIDNQASIAPNNQSLLTFLALITMSFSSCLLHLKTAILLFICLLSFLICQ